ncbi:unnamed protein product [Absidia cylindrospora]
MGSTPPRHGHCTRAHPYEHHSVYPPKQPQQPQQQQHHQHILSPEQLGVVGYVKDVAGFVKDTVQDIRENRQRRRSSSEEANRQRQVENSTEQTEATSTTTPQSVSPPPPAQQQLASSSLATIATGMFPGISGSGQQQQQQQQQQLPLGTSPPCTHAEALRQDLREQLQHSSSEKEHRLL